MNNKKAIDSGCKSKESNPKTASGVKPDDLSLLDCACPDHQMSRHFFMSSRLVLAWITRFIESQEHGGLHGAWAARDRALLLAAASGAPNIPEGLNDSRVYGWATGIEAIELQAKRPGGAGAQAWLKQLPGYEAGCSIKTPAHEQHNGSQQILWHYYNWAWQVAEVYQSLPESEWRQVERLGLEYSRKPNGTPAWNDPFEDEGEKNLWLAKFKKHVLSSQLVKVKSRGKVNRI